MASGTQLSGICVLYDDDSSARTDFGNPAPTSLCPGGPDGSGFYISRTQNAAPLSSSNFAEYYYSAPNANSYITAAAFLYVRHEGFWTNTTQGMWSRNRGRFSHNLTDWRNLNYEQRIVCVDGYVSAAHCDDYPTHVYGANNNYVQSSISPNASAQDGRYSFRPAHMYFGGAQVWLSDANNPVATYFESLPTGWVDEVPARGYSGADQQAVRFDDAGLGMKSLSLDVPGRARQTTTDGCSGAHSWRCPAYRVGVFSLEGIDEGVQTVRATGGDATQRAGAAQGTVKVDRTQPQEPTASGQLAERVGAFVASRGLGGSLERQTSGGRLCLLAIRHREGTSMTWSSWCTTRISSQTTRVRVTVMIERITLLG